MRTIIIYLNAFRVSYLLSSMLLVTGGMSQAHLVHDYAVYLDDRLQYLRVQARFAKPVHDIRARSGTAHRFLHRVRDCESDKALRIAGRRLSLPKQGVICIEYVVNLEQAAAAERRNAGLAHDNIVVSPAVWLWRPALTRDTRIVVHFAPQAGVGASVPWQPLDGCSGSYELTRSPRNARAMTAFGRFVYAEKELPGANLRIALLRPRGNIDTTAIIDWVGNTAGNVSLAYGRFPNPSPHVVVLPLGRSGWRSDSPVPFGRVLRDGGESVELFINERRPIEDFYNDWTATHEFSHLMLPYLRSPHRWISEGFAQYYQNVLLARAGRYDESRAWQKLHDGFERGRRSRPELSPNEAARRGVRAATMKIYWSGAAIALMADVELRLHSDGRESLDYALDRLQQCCLPATASWSGIELFGRLDSFVDQPVFMPLYRRYANARGFPEVAPVFERLGIDVRDNRIRLRDDAELAEIRRAITAERFR